MRVYSSNIREAEYDKDRHILTMVFINRPRWRYTYRNVPPKIWTGFLRSESKGRFFEQNIRNSYSFSKIVF